MPSDLRMNCQHGMVLHRVVSIYSCRLLVWLARRISHQFEPRVRPFGTPQDAKPRVGDHGLDVGLILQIILDENYRRRIFPRLRNLDLIRVSVVLPDGLHGSVSSAVFACGKWPRSTRWLLSIQPVFT